MPASVDVAIVDFSFQYAEKVLHGCGVVTVAFSGHTLEDAVFFQHGLIDGHLLAPAAIGVKGPPVGAGLALFDGFF